MCAYVCLLKIVFLSFDLVLLRPQLSLIHVYILSQTYSGSLSHTPTHAYTIYLCCLCVSVFVCVHTCIPIFLVLNNYEHVLTCHTRCGNMNKPAHILRRTMMMMMTAATTAATTTKTMNAKRTHTKYAMWWYMFRQNPTFVLFLCTLLDVMSVRLSPYVHVLVFEWIHYPIHAGTLEYTNVHVCQYIMHVTLNPAWNQKK